MDGNRNGSACTDSSEYGDGKGSFSADPDRETTSDGYSDILLPRETTLNQLARKRFEADMNTWEERLHRLSDLGDDEARFELGRLEGRRDTWVEQGPETFKEYIKREVIEDLQENLDTDFLYMTGVTRDFYLLRSELEKFFLHNFAPRLARLLAEGHKSSFVITSNISRRVRWTPDGVMARYFCWEIEQLESNGLLIQVDWTPYMGTLVGKVEWQ